MPAIDNQHEVDRVRSYTQELTGEISKMGIWPRCFEKYPFDQIGLALVSKAFSICNALLVLLDAGFAEEAFGLSRSLVDCALTLRFLTQDRDQLLKRTLDYAQFEVLDKQFWMHYLLRYEAGQPAEQKIREFAKQYDLEDDPTGASAHWSGKRNGFAWKVNLENHPLDLVSITEADAAKAELAKKAAYAVDYHAPSSFAHCYSPVVNNFLPPEGVAFNVKESSGEYEKPSQTVLFTLVSYLFDCVAYALFGLNEARSQRMNDLHSEALASLLPYRQTRS